MEKRCTRQVVRETYKETGSWRKTADHLNHLYGANLSHTAWRDYATGKHDIADQGTRARLLLGPRTCPTCGHTPRDLEYSTERKESFDQFLKIREPMQ